VTPNPMARVRIVVVIFAVAVLLGYVAGVLSR
jgi:hypothetical protein